MKKAIGLMMSCFLFFVGALFLGGCNQAPYCLNNGNCPNGHVCRNNACEPAECTNVTCPQGQVCSAGSCVQQTQQQDAGTNPTPDTTQTSCGEKGERGCPCTKTAECHDLLVCSAGKCGGCSADEQCNADNRKSANCIEGLCQKRCVSDQECPNPQIEICVKVLGSSIGNCLPRQCDTNKLCDKGLECVANRCHPKKCETDNSCPYGHICFESTCVSGCRVHQDCGTGAYCQDYKCVPGCLRDENCATSQYCEAGDCNNAPSRCGANLNCQSGFVCVGGQYCKPRVCGVQKDCPEGQTCVTGRCVPAPKECTTDTDCNDREICEESIGKKICGTGCRKNSDCAGGEKCEIPRKLCVRAECVNDADCRAGHTCQINHCVVIQTENPAIEQVAPDGGQVDGGTTDSVSVDTQPDVVHLGECQLDSHCPQDLPRCLRQQQGSQVGKCVPCLEDKDCGAGKMCLLSTNACVIPPAEPSSEPVVETTSEPASEPVADEQSPQDAGQEPSTPDTSTPEPQVTETQVVEVKPEPSCTPQSELCNGKDDNCNGKIDEDFPAKGSSCETGLGACKVQGTFVCSGDGTKLECQGLVPSPKPQPETCNGIDDDCDGLIDEGFATGTSCTVGVGECKVGGVVVCKADATGTYCRPSTQQPTPQTEICNGKDDDCNGLVDEQSDVSCSTACGSGMRMCVNGTLSACNAPQPQTEICDGKDNDCNGKVDELPECQQECANAATRPCYTGPTQTKGIGSCKDGTQTCVQGKWDVCKDQILPIQEICNGKDDDCDGLVDEQSDVSCSTACGSGMRMCVNGTLSACNAPQPQPEICDGKDNNCDGKVDEGFGTGTSCTVGVGECKVGGVVVCKADATGTYCRPSTQQPTPQTEICNGKDDDCNGLVDEQSDVSCSTACGSGMRMCVNGTLSACNAPQPQPEICDGKDNNCDGKVDEGFGTGTSCTVGVGECKVGGVVVCKADATGTYCRPSTQQPTPQTEICNGKDDDCDGLVDEQSDVSCSTACGSGMRICVNGTLSACNAPQPQTEICDGKDNNCDGKVDEGFATGTSCTVGVGECKVDGVVVCKADATGTYCRPSTQQPTPQTEICNGKDDDCDGLVDEDFPAKGSSCEVGRGACKVQGTLVCSGDGTKLECKGLVQQPTPQPETCNGIDDDCDGLIDNNISGAGDSCYDGAPGTKGVGPCKGGVKVCNSATKTMECQGQVLPTPETVNCDGVDNDCNGTIDDGASSVTVYCRGMCLADWLCPTGGACPHVRCPPTNAQGILEGDLVYTGLRYLVAHVDVQTSGGFKQYHQCRDNTWTDSSYTTALSYQSFSTKVGKLPDGSTGPVWGCVVKSGGSARVVLGSGKLLLVTPNMNAYCTDRTYSSNDRVTEIRVCGTLHTGQ